MAAGKAGRPSYEPTEKDRKTVEAMTACGMTNDDIGAVLGISDVTLRKHFRAELDTGMIRANAKVAATLFSMATSGACPAATFFWMKVRLKWKEPSSEHRIVDEQGKDRDIVTVSAREQIASGIARILESSAAPEDPAQPE